MTTYTLTIKKSNKTVQAILNLIRATDELDLEENNINFELTQSQKNILDNRKMNHLSGKSKSYTWDEIKEKAMNAK